MTPPPLPPGSRVIAHSYLGFATDPIRGVVIEILDWPGAPELGKFRVRCDDGRDRWFDAAEMEREAQPTTAPYTCLFCGGKQNGTYHVFPKLSREIVFSALAEMRPDAKMSDPLTTEYRYRRALHEGQKWADPPYVYFSIDDPPNFTQPPTTEKEPT